MATGTLRNLLPGTLVKDAVRLELDHFLRLYGTAPLLLVRLGEDDTDLRTGLQNLWLPTGVRSAARVAPMKFRTELLRAPAQPAPAPKAAPPRRHDDVLRVLEKGPHFAALLRSKGGAARISLGRAPNNDVVLRHTSVSKFHASLEPTGEGTIKIVDTGSTNKTAVNDVAVRSRVAVEARSGDRLSFGNVDAVLWSPRALWASQHEG
jgi:hypothetical protein